MDNTQIKECVQYFRSFPVYEKVLAELKKKYISLGRAGGAVIFSNLTRAEKEQLQGFLPKVNPYDEGKVRITAADFEKALSESRYETVTMRMLLEAFFQSPIETKSQRKEEYKNRWDALFRDIQNNSSGGDFQEWIEYVLESKANAYTFIQKRFRESEAELKKMLMIQDKAIAMLPVKQKKTLRLPVFSASVTGNPHYFDDGTFGEKLLTYFLCYRTEVCRQTPVFLTEEKWDRFYSVGIMKDDLSNHVLSYGIRGIQIDGSEHEGMKGFCTAKQPVHLSLWTLSSLAAARSVKNQVYVVENPAVFAALIEKFPREISMVCTNGQLHLASLVLLDLLVKEGNKLIYAGDFDPEGLQIADKLKRKYGEHLHFWLYDGERYERSLSKVKLSDERLHKLQSISSKELMPVVDCVERKKRAGYQESLLGEYIRDFLEIINERSGTNEDPENTDAGK